MSSDPLPYLPTSEEQDWLVSRLGELIARCGKAPFVDQPIVEPTKVFFPDAWTFSHRGLDRLVRRLMQYAGLGDLDVRIGTYVELEGWEARPAERHHASTAGLFMGIVEGRCLFAFNQEAPADAEFMAGVMCHEVAHAYRAHHRLVRETTVDEEECLTDLTTVYLGFGILAANNSFRSRTSSWSAGALAYHQWSTQSTGYLPPQAFSFLLAAQIVARDPSSSERRRILDHLEPDQAGFTKAAVHAILDRQRDIMGVLQLTPGREAGRLKPLADILQPLPEYIEPERQPVDEAHLASVLANRGRPVFRVPKNRLHAYGVLGLVVGTVPGFIAAIIADQPLIMAVGFVLGGTVGAVRGRRARYEVCCDPVCSEVLEPGATTCPRCGGFIAGTIAHENERVEAAEEWERRAAERPKARKVRQVPSHEDVPPGL